MKAWPLIVGMLVLEGCSSRVATPQPVAFRGPEVTIDVQPSGRAERLLPPKPATAPATHVEKPKPPTKPKPKPKPQKRHKSKPKVEVVHEERLPPDEDFIPDRDDQDDGGMGIFPADGNRRGL